LNTTRQSPPRVSPAWHLPRIARLFRLRRTDSTHRLPPRLAPCSEKSEVRQN